MEETHCITGRAGQNGAGHPGQQRHPDTRAADSPLRMQPPAGEADYHTQ